MGTPPNTIKRFVLRDYRHRSSHEGMDGAQVHVLPGLVKRELERVSLVEYGRIECHGRWFYGCDRMINRVQVRPRHGGPGAHRYRRGNV